MNAIRLGAVVALVASYFSSLAPTALADNYPNGPVRILVPLGTGSQADILARLIAQKLSESWRQPVIVDNRPGALGSIAGSMLVKAAPDGRTLMVHSDGHAVSAALYGAKLPYDTLRDISRVAQIASFPTVLVTSPSLGLKSVKDLIAAANARPGQLTFGSAGTGGGLHLSGEMFKVAAKIDVTHVPYKGPADALADTIAERIHFMFAPPGLTLPHIKQGRLRAIAVGSEQRSQALPDVPTIAESGLPGFAYDLWTGLFAPSATPKSIIERINQDVGRVMALPDVQSQLANQYLVYRKNSPEEFDNFVRSAVARLTNVIRIAGIKVE